MSDDIKALRNLMEQVIVEMRIIKKNQDNYAVIFNQIHQRLQKLERKEAGK